MYKDFILHCQTKYTATGIILILTLLLFMSCTLSASVRAADDNYLKELEVEAENSAQVTNQKKSKNNSGLSVDQKEFKQFESAMKSRRPAIYRFYKKLNKDDKSIIFSIYQEDQKFTRASKVVFDLYFDKNK